VQALRHFGGDARTQGSGAGEDTILPCQPPRVRADRLALPVTDYANGCIRLGGSTADGIRR